MRLRTTRGDHFSFVVSIVKLNSEHQRNVHRSFVAGVMS